MLREIVVTQCADRTCTRWSRVILIRSVGGTADSNFSVVGCCHIYEKCILYFLSAGCYSWVVST